MILIIGLGNFEKKYDNTYHNIGFMAIDALIAHLGGKWNKKYCQAVICETNFNGQKVILAKPQTYMNLSGESVLQLKNKFKVENQDILIILDDIDLPKGSVRFRKSGSAGTHNGLRNIINLLGSKDVARIRIGIGNDKSMDLADYVLSKIKKEDNMQIQNAILQAIDIITKQFLLGIKNGK